MILTSKNYSKHSYLLLSNTLFDASTIKCTKTSVCEHASTIKYTRHVHASMSHL